MLTVTRCLSQRSKRGRGGLDSWFQKTQGMVRWLCYSGACVSPSIMVKCVSKQSRSLCGSQEAERDSQGMRARFTLSASHGGAHL